MSSTATVLRDVRSADAEACARGLRRVTQLLATDSVHGQRPADWQVRRDELQELEPRFHALAASDNEVLRELVSDLLGAWLGDEALRLLLVLARDEVERVRASAVGALESWPENAAAKDAVLDGAQSNKWTIRMRAMRALYAFAGPEVVDALFSGLVDDDSYVRQGAADSLARRPLPEFHARLRRLADYPAPHMLDAAMDLFGTIGTADDAAFLAKTGSWLNLSQPGFVRAWARKAAKRIRARIAGS
jgi:HEAT repeat protein